MVERVNPALPISQQCRLLALPRSSVYRKPAELSAEDLAIMALIDRQYLARPYYGSRRMAAWLATQGHCVNRKRVQRLMRLLGLAATALVAYGVWSTGPAGAAVADDDFSTGGRHHPSFPPRQNQDFRTAVRRWRNNHLARGCEGANAGPAKPVGKHVVLGLPERLLGVGLPLTILLGFVFAAIVFPSLGILEMALLAAILAPTDAALGKPVVTNPGWRSAPRSRATSSGWSSKKSGSEP
jgi:putative transposase